jgi:repressor LexA
MSQLAAALRRRRLALGLTLQQLADQVGCSKAYLSAIENDRLDNPPRSAILGALERTLAITDGELARLADWQRTPRPVRVDFQRLAAQQHQLRQLLQHAADSSSSRGRCRRSLDTLWKSGDLQQWLEQGQPNVHPLAGVSVQVPLINRVAAGYPSDFTDLDYPARVADQYVSCADLTDPQAFAARVVGSSMEPDYHEGDVIVFSPAEPPRDGADCFARLLPDHDTTFKRIYFEDDQRIRLQPLNPAFAAQVLPLDQVAGLYPAVYRMQRLIPR